MVLIAKRFAVNCIKTGQWRFCASVRMSGLTRLKEIVWTPTDTCQ